MAFKLSKAELERRSSLVQSLSDKKGQLEAEIEAYNSEVQELRGSVEEALDGYNTVLVEAKAFCDDIASTRQSEYDEKSDKWQEGDRASAAADWISEWENFEGDEIQLDWPEELELPDAEHGEALDGIAEEISE
jgi:chromosome segregation ATPase